MAFDGTDDFVTVPDDDVFSFTDGVADASRSDKPFSMQAWVMIDDLDGDGLNDENGSIITKFNGNTEVEWFFGQNKGQIVWNLYDEDGKLTSGASKSLNRLKCESFNIVLEEDTWHHVVVTYDGSKNPAGLKVYVDGAAVAVVTDTQNTYNGMLNTSLDVVIGSTVAGTSDFEQKMTNAAIFNKELSATEVSELYNNGRVLNLATFSDYESIIAWWKLGDGDTLPVAIDSKGGRNGTVTNATLVDEPGAARPGIFVTDGFSTENQRFLNLRISEAGNNAQPAVTVWLKSYGMGYDRWAKLDTFSGVQNSVVTHVIDINGADRALLIWDGNGNDVKISAGCSTF